MPVVQQTKKSLCKSFILALLLVVLLATTGAAEINSLSAYTSYPPSVTANMAPNVIFALDTSGSMKQPAYTQTGVDWKSGVQTDFSAATDYFGYFDSKARYRYATEQQFFYADPSGDWDGNFLNWATMRRIDVARKVLVGGKVSLRTLNQDAASPSFGQPAAINRTKARQLSNWQQGWDQWYVLEGQNEPFDFQFYKQFARNATDLHTPSAIADGTSFLISNQRLIPQNVIGGSALPLSAQVEIGQLTLASSAAEQWHWVPFVNRYQQPRVVVKTQTLNAAKPLADPRIRLKNGWDGAGNDGFFVRLQPWDYVAGEQSAETFAYLVVESKSASGAALGCLDIADEQGGVWQFCAEADAQPVATANCGAPGSATGVVPQQINWDAPLPRSKPLVFSGIMTWNENGDTDALNVRIAFPGGTLDRSAVLATIQEQESNGGGSSCRHDSVEQLAAIAVVPPAGRSGTSAASWSYAGQRVTIQAGVFADLTQDWQKLVYDSNRPFSAKPIFIADLQTFNDADPVTIRVDGSSAANNQSHIELKLQEETSADGENSHAGEEVGWLAVEFNGGFAIRVALKDEPLGLVQKMAGSMRLGLAVYNYDHDLPATEIYSDNQVNGGNLYPCFPDPELPPARRTTTDICLPTGVHDPLANIVRVVEEHPLIWGTTPLAETLYEIKNYLQQNNNGEGFYADQSPKPTYPYGIVAAVDQDPYQYRDFQTGEQRKLACAETFVLHLTDGEPDQDWDGNAQPLLTGDGDGATGSDEMLDDVAYALRHGDLRSDPELPGQQSVISYYLQAALGDADAAQYSRATRRLREAAINGGFALDPTAAEENYAPDPPHPVDVNQYLLDNRDPATGRPDCAAKRNEWDRDGDCNPDNFSFAKDGFALQQQLEAALQSIVKRTSSATAASVVSSSRSGAGALYQAVFFPHYDDRQGQVVSWAGQLHALLLDDYGNLREDTDKNGRLDLDTDLIVRFDAAVDGGLLVRKYADGLGLAANGRLESDELAQPVATGTLEDLSFLWNSSDWLNAAQLDALAQRNYQSSARQRYIFTYLDDGDQVPVASELIAFSAANWAMITPYLHVAEPFSFSAANPPDGVQPADFDQFLRLQARRQIDWVRGEDQAALAFSNSFVPAMRSRQYRTSAGSPATWRLGDIVNSTPTAVGRPAENFDLLYRDSSYAEFYRKYKDRRNVVYVGANDGLFHAFNAGFYHPASKAYLLQPLTGAGQLDSSKTDFALGAELWAYLPQNLLPHLYWLTRPNYSHVYYNDLPPKVFDARIFAPDDRHPGGWGTLLVGGMRLGGGAINADLNQNGQLDASDSLLSSAFFILDITDPEVPPTLLAEISLPGLGFTTSYPTVITQYDPSSDASSNYLLLGSGPANAAGVPDSKALQEVASRQRGKIFLLDLNQLTSGSGRVCFRTASGRCIDAADDPQPLVSLDADSYISPAISVDWDLDYSVDAVYFGTISGNQSAGWGGKFRRIVIDDDRQIANWDTDSLLLDLSVGQVTADDDGQPVTTGQPISAAATAGLQQQSGGSERWLYFGTGRYQTVADAENDDQQSFYGLKEPKDASGFWTYAPLHRDHDLLDVSRARVYDGGADVKDVGGVSTFNLLLSEIDQQQGWLMNFSDDRERNLTQATLLGNVLTFTSYQPQQSPCGGAGESWLYALDCRTGTAASQPLLGTFELDKTTSEDHVAERERNKKREKIGRGIASSPALHTGRQRGAKVFLQSSDAGIITLEQTPAGSIKSSMLSWEVE